PSVFHGIAPFHPDTGKLKSNSNGRSYTNVFSDWLCDMASEDNNLVAITPAMREGSGLVAFSKQFPDRYYDVGIAEQHALTFAGGMACEGIKPVVAIYSTFLQRAYDQLIHDITTQDLDITLAIDRAGLVGADGATHSGSFDFSFLACIPRMVIMAPADEAECRDMLFTAYQHKGPASVRYPRGVGPGVSERKEMRLIPLGQSETRREGVSVAILAWGSLVATAERVGEKIGATVINMRFVKPLDQSRVIELAKENQLIVTLEENALNGGAGSLVNQLLLAEQIDTPILNLGLPDTFVAQGSQQELLAELSLDPAGVLASIERFRLNQSDSTLHIPHATQHA
ncbi:MAG: 1-deoxy-D-xylulose-5-phosphate synthase, partial [Methylococcales bacterium]|nr:1-deoxy-D-xylulose-5-phosphate synthase [Methylococcales bacterium]